MLPVDRRAMRSSCFARGRAAVNPDWMASRNWNPCRIISIATSIVGWTSDRYSMSISIIWFVSCAMVRSLSKFRFVREMLWRRPRSLSLIEIEAFNCWSEISCKRALYPVVFFLAAEGEMVFSPKQFRSARYPCLLSARANRRASSEDTPAVYCLCNWSNWFTCLFSSEESCSMRKTIPSTGWLVHVLPLVYLL